MAKTADLTRRSMDLARDRGWLVMKTEYWLPSFASRKIVDAAKTWMLTGNTGDLRNAIELEKRMGPGVRKDLFGFIDVFAMTEKDFIAIQITSWDNVSARKTKIKTECLEYSQQWLKCGGRIQIWGWKKEKRRGTRKLWHHRVVEITLDEMPGIREPGSPLNKDLPF